MLSLSDSNCPYYTNFIAHDMAEINQQAVDHISSLGSEWSSLIAESSIGDLCSYLDWAANNSVALTGLPNIGDATHYCQNVYSIEVTKTNLGFDSSTGHIMSSEFLSKLNELIDISQSPSRAEGLHPHELPLGFINFQTLNVDILHAFAMATLDWVQEGSTLPASSNLIFEIGTDGIVKAFHNDEEYTPMGCNMYNPCTVETFQKRLKAMISSQNVSDVCSGASDLILQ